MNSWRVDDKLALNGETDWSDLLANAIPLILSHIFCLSFVCHYQLRPKIANSKNNTKHTHTLVLKGYSVCCAVVRVPASNVSKHYCE